MAMDSIDSLDFCTTGRKKRLEQLANGEFDIIVIGGGITGAGIARDATMRGFRVALLDKNDFSFGTSSRSSKLAHGGFRYLKSLEFGLVRESEAERNWLRNDFPNLVRPLPVIAPSFEGEKYGMFMVWLGVSLYNLLDHYKNYKKGRVYLRAKKIKKFEPALDATGLKGFGLIYDTNIDDARLTVETIKEAVHSGRCTAVNYARVTRLNHDESTGKVNGAWFVDEDPDTDTSTKETLVRAPIVVNSTGIWTDELLDNVPEGYPDPVIRPTKGVHIVFKKKDVPVNNALGITSHIDGRFFFVLDRDNFIVIGTTDTDYHGDLGDPRCTAEDAEYLLSTVRMKFPDANLDLENMVGSYAGIRPLARPPAKKGKPASESEVSRDHEIIRSTDDLVSICGGKLTTFRVMAEDLMRGPVKSIATELLPSREFNWKKKIAKQPYKISLTRDEWDDTPLVQECKEMGYITDEQCTHLYQQYGRGALVILQYLKEDETLAERLVPGEDVTYAPWIMAEIKYVVLHDCPMRLTDIMARRLEFQWCVHPSLQPGASRKVARYVASLLDWDDNRVTREINDYMEYLAYNSFFYDGKLE